eukprot:4293045-Amphidinium_carterae.1
MHTPTEGVPRLAQLGIQRYLFLCTLGLELGKRREAGKVKIFCSFWEFRFGGKYPLCTTPFWAPCFPVRRACGFGATG